MTDGGAAAAGMQGAEMDPRTAQVQTTRAWTGLLVVLGGDVAIAVAAVLGIVLATALATAQLVAILTAAFTAISSMTSAYFGIRAATNAAQSSVNGLQAVAAARAFYPAGGGVSTIQGQPATGATSAAPDR